MGTSTGLESAPAQDDHNDENDDQHGNGIGEARRPEPPQPEQAAEGSQPSDSISGLEEMLSSLSPALRPGKFVFTTVPADAIALLQSADATVIEDEGISAVLSKDLADEAGLFYDYEAAWITLRVSSALDAVGLTAAVSSSLAERGISCNVIAGRHHDHLLVGWEQREYAMAALQDLAQSSRSEQTAPEHDPIMTEQASE